MFHNFQDLDMAQTTSNLNLSLYFTLKKKNPLKSSIHTEIQMTSNYIKYPLS